jgi:hypothetical protein
MNEIKHIKEKIVPDGDFYRELLFYITIKHMESRSIKYLDQRSII